ncbi:MAG TPA: HAMP domain-containing sensor histidine kinase, partial [Kofleriaceae bacterium]|nr:HAMP domain-containing sensor histidine kinase [Kofleriaceae bacterium]
EEVGAATVAAGALDFLAKVDMSPSRLARRLLYVLRLARAEAHLRRASTDLEDQRHLLDALVSQLPTGVVVVDRALTAAQIANARAEEVVGAGAAELFAPAPGSVAERARAALAEAIATGDAATIEGTVSHGDRELRLRATPMVGERSAGAILVIDDVTDEVMARRTAERAAKAREELLAIVSHDLRGPLSAIGIALEGLRDVGLDAPAREKYIAAVQRSVARGERLIRDLLLAHQLEAGGVRVEPRSLAVRSLLEQVARDHELVAGNEGVKVVLDIAADADRVWADKDRLNQAFANLFDNAFRHARGTPAIELAARVDPGGAVHLSVRDHGPGVAAEALPHVFDRYWQGRNRRGGAGLGLAIVRGIARAHGGDAFVANHPEGGAQFTIVLPPPPVSATPSPGRA